MKSGERQAAIPSGIATCFLSPLRYTLSIGTTEKEVSQPMTVYLDTAFALNSAVNYFLLLSAARLAGAPIRRGRFLLAAALGGLYAAATFLPSLVFLRAAGIKAVLLAVMALAAFGARRQTIRLALLFAAAAAALAGAAMLAVQLLHIGALILPGGVFYPLSPRAILLLAALLCGLCHLVFSCVTAHSGHLIPLTIRLGPRCVSLCALHDTGNTLKDPLTGEAVLVAGWEVAAQLLPDAALRPEDLLHPADCLPELQRRCPALHPRLIPYHAVGTDSGLLLAVRCDVSSPGQKPAARLVAFSPTPVSRAGEFEVLTGGYV